MAIDVKPLECPQCGSVETEPSSNNRWVCKFCGTSFLLQPRVETQNVYNENHYYYDKDDSPSKNKSCIIARIKTQYPQSEFIRQAWIGLAQQDAPFQVFQSDFSKVDLVEHQVVVDYASVTLNYQASIGYDREESYTVYETYNENGEEKQRAVTKTRTVTDWRPMQGNIELNSTVAAENTSNLYFDDDLFRASYNSAEENDIAFLTEEEEKKYKVSDSALEEVSKKHEQYYENMISSSLPGEHQKDITYSTLTKESSTSLLLTPEYKTTVALDGKTYTRRAFPFGKMPTGGDEIPNPESLASQLEKKRSKIPRLVWGKNKPLYIASILLILLSVILSLVVRQTFLTVAAFLAALALFIVTWVAEVKTHRQIGTTIEAECATITEEYRKKQLSYLNEKLRSLGMDSADISDIEEE